MNRAQLQQTEKQAQAHYIAWLIAEGREVEAKKIQELWK